MPEDKTLHVKIAEYHVGNVTQREGGRLSFEYKDEWRNGNIQIPLSLSMPLTLKRHSHQAIEAFIWGLLPDNPQTIERWAAQFQVSPRSPFALISAVGQDCAGAMQFILPSQEAEAEKDTLSILSEEEIGTRLKELRKDGAATRHRSDNSQFSLAGAQAKTAFYLDPVTNEWGIPGGRMPTTHILKPPMPHLNGHTENEHYCLKLAGLLGMDAAASSVLEFSGEKAIVVERYDRRFNGKRVIRIHQEDMCQALGLMPSKKYENEGGPGIQRIVSSVLISSDDPAQDTLNFFKANIFNYLIYGTDAHAKNYSMLLGPRSTSKLAPLYDVSSILPHLGEAAIPDTTRDLRLSMKVAEHYKVDEIMLRHWKTSADNAKFPADDVIAILLQLIEELPDFASKCAKICHDEGLRHPIILKLADLLAQRAIKLKRLHFA